MSLKQTGKYFFLLLLLTACICACASKEKRQEGKSYQIYYVNKEGTAISPYEYTTETTDREALLNELLQQLGTASEKLEYKPPLESGFSLLNYSLAEDQLILSFDEGYKAQEKIAEILVRASIVRTLTQIEGIRYVSFQIKSEPLTDASGAVVGIMNAEQFVDNAGNEINTYEKVKLTLYLADESGERLKPVNRTVVYNSNISMERLVVEQLVGGPKESEKAFPVINPETKVISVNVKDGICYIDFDSAFLTQIYNVTSEVAIYSIVDSVAELSNVNKVQISVNGSTTVSYKENISLSTVFERSLEIVN